MLQEIPFELLFQVTDNQVLRNGGVEKVLFPFWSHDLVISCDSVFEMTEKQFTQPLEFFQFQVHQVKGTVERMLLIVLDSLALSFDAGQQVVVMQDIHTEPRGDRSWVDVEVVEQERPTEGEDLNDRQRFQSLHFLPHMFLQSLLLFGQQLLASFFLLLEREVGASIFLQGCPAAQVDVFGHFRVHDHELRCSASVSFLDLVEFFLPNVAVGVGQSAQRMKESSPSSSNYHSNTIQN